LEDLEPFSEIISEEKLVILIGKNYSRPAAYSQDI
jgi:hypothetical protein